MKQIVEAIKNKRCVIFAGAGLSRNAGLPDWFGLAKELCNKLKEKHYLSEEDISNIEPFLKRKRQTIPMALDLIHAKVGRPIMCEALREILEPKVSSRVHEILKDIQLKGYVTTNYDRLLDQIISANAHRLSNSLTDLKQVSYVASQFGRQFLLKLHGDIDNMLPATDDTVMKGGAFMVLTNSDYVAFQTSRAEQLRMAMYALLQGHSILFLGYSFDDPDINWILKSIVEYCVFTHPSWYMALTDDSVPALPSGVEVIKPLADWSELPTWLEKIKEELNNTPVPPKPTSMVFRKVTEEERKALKILSEYISGLESEDLCERILGIVVIDEIKDKEYIDRSFVVDFIRTFLNVGPSWGESFAKCAIGHLRKLGIIKEEGNIIKVSKTVLQTLQQKARVEWEDDRNQFLDSVSVRIKDSGSPLGSNFEKGLDDILQVLCADYGRRMAEWIQWGITQELEQGIIEQIINGYFKQKTDKRVAEEVIRLIMNNPSGKEVNYLYRLISASFLLSSIKLDPVASKFVRETMQQYEIYLDANIILPLVVKEHENNRWIKSTIDASIEFGATLLVLNDIWEEVTGHRGLASNIFHSCKGDLKLLSQYELITGPRANCFIKGFLRVQRDNGISWKDYMGNYRDDKLEKSLGRFRIKKIEVGESEFDRVMYKEVLRSIENEWGKRLQFAGRNPRLNEHETIQFLQIYKRRKEVAEEGRPADVWFLSTETVLEKVYLRTSHKWGKPPTFPLSAWAGFLDSRLVFEHKNRKDVLTAILKGSSTAYGLPEPEEIIRRKAFGENKVLSDGEAEALQLAMTDGTVIRRLEQAISQLRKKGSSRDSTDEIREFEEATAFAVGEVEEGLKEKISNLEGRLSEYRKSSAGERKELEREIEKLKATIETLSTLSEKKKKGLKASKVKKKNK